MKLEQYKKTRPELVLEDYFRGKTKAYGMFIDLFGNLKARFVVDIEGQWDGRILTLKEDFVYDNGRKEKRLWSILKTPGGGYEGRAEGVVGKALGKTAGSALNWSYRFDLKTRNNTFRVKFDDWMFLQPEGVLLNIARVRKFGLVLGTLYLSFRKI